MSLWLTMVLAGLATFLIRFSFIGSAGKLAPPDWFQNMLRFIPIAALTALVWPDMLLVQGQVAFDNPRLFAGLLAAVVAYKTQNIFLTIAVGMVALWLMQWGLGA